MKIVFGCLLLLSGLAFLVAVPKGRPKNDEADVIEGIGPSNSFYDHFIGKLQHSNGLVHLAMQPHGILPPDDDYVDTPVPVAHYAFVNPALNGQSVPHWTHTLENFKNNPLVSPEIKDQVLKTVPSPIKIYGDGTESKFPLFIEYFVQRLQNYFSTYVYEDLSRPASWDVKENATDNQVVSAEKEPVTESGKVELASNAKLTTPSSITTEEDIDYIVDFTARPYIDEIPDVQLTDEDFDKTTEEWEATKEEFDNKNATNVNLSPPQVIVVKETLDLKVVDPIAVEEDTFLYVGDGTGDELNRSNRRKKLRKKKRN